MLLRCNPTSSFQHMMIRACHSIWGVHRSWRQVFLTTAGMVAVINSVLVGICVGLLLSALLLPLLSGNMFFTQLIWIYHCAQRRFEWCQNLFSVICTRVETLIDDGLKKGVYRQEQYNRPS